MMKFAPKLLTRASLCALTCGLLLSATAHAQWGWTDKDGRRIFSDQAPGAEIADKNVFKRPAGAKASAVGTVTPLGQTDANGKSASTDPKDVAKEAQAAALAAASAPKTAASGPKVSGKDSELEKKKKETEAAEAAKKKAEETKQAAARAENCERAKKSLATLNSGVRVATTNAKGERDIMGDTDRAAEVKRTQDIVSSECK